jgi:hypothetical protein
MTREYPDASHSGRGGLTTADGSRRPGCEPRSDFAFEYLPSTAGIHGPPAIDMSVFQDHPSGAMYEMTRRCFAGFPSIRESHAWIHLPGSRASFPATAPPGFIAE